MDFSGNFNYWACSNINQGVWGKKSHNCASLQFHNRWINYTKHQLDNGDILKNLHNLNDEIMKYDEIKIRFRNGNMIKSLKDGVVREYSGFLTLIGIGIDAIGYDSINKDLIVYKNGILAEIMEQGIDKYEEHSRHIENVLKTCKRLGCTTTQLLRMDYISEINKT